MIFIDTSSYISVLNPFDINHKPALSFSKKIFSRPHDIVTSHAILGEVLTVGSMRYNRHAAIEFVKTIYKSDTKVVLENDDLLEKAFKLFQKITDKNVSWVDCYSFAIIEYYKIERVFTFDKDFKKYAKAKVIS